MDTKHLLTKQEAADVLRVSTRTLDRFANAGKIAPTRIGDRVLFAPREIQRFIEANTATVSTGPVLATA